MADRRQLTAPENNQTHVPAASFGTVNLTRKKTKYNQTRRVSRG
jgi:hypothetical protein